MCSWEMEPGSESSQHQKRKPVTHGLEDQKRVSDKRPLCLNCWMRCKWQKTPYNSSVSCSCCSLCLARSRSLLAIYLKKKKKSCLSVQTSCNVWSKELRGMKIAI